MQKDYTKLIDNANLDNWKESLALILTYGKPEEFAQLCGMFIIMHRILVDISFLVLEGGIFFFIHLQINLENVWSDHHAMTSHLMLYCVTYALAI